MAYSSRIMANSAELRHLLLLLALILQLVALQNLSLMQVCEAARPSSITDDATSNPTENPSVLQGARTVTNLRAFFQSIVNNLLDFPLIIAPPARGQNVQGLETAELDLEAPEKRINTSGAGIIYNADNIWIQQPEEFDNDHQERGYLLMHGNSKSCETGNYIDDCWRCDSKWQDKRQSLASCAIGFGRNAIGGKNGNLYVVTSNKDDLTNPPTGTLRYGVTRKEPLWIIFANDMTLELKGELIVSSFKTIDGRGAKVHLVGASQITIKGVSNVIVHSIHVHDIVKSGSSDGDAINIRGSSNVWIDHCYLANATDGLIDSTKNSTNITISNTYFERHDKVMLFGADPKDDFDRNMQVTVAFNKFGPGLQQRMPRCRYGNCHVANNFYTSGWGSYAMGGSQDPTFLSQGNRFVGPDISNRKEVTSRIDDGGPTFGGWQKWDWVSTGDSFENGAFFRGSGVQDASASNYNRARSFVPRHNSLVAAMTEDAGPLTCVAKSPCKGSSIISTVFS